MEGTAMPNNGNREEWLQKAIAQHITPLFEQHEYKVPEVRVSCGFPVALGHQQHEATDRRVLVIHGSRRQACADLHLAAARRLRRCAGDARA
jgi:hypothetical protein